MKLYIEKGELMFDYSDVDVNADLNKKTSRYRQFLRESPCAWEPVGKSLMRWKYEPYGAWTTGYGEAKHYEHVLSSCYYLAKRTEFVEVAKDVEELLQKTAVQCKQLYEAELAKEQERERAEKWQSVCNHGCGGCSNLRRCNDDYFCTASGDLLPEKNKSGVVRGEYRLFNYVAFPSENCAFNIKNKEKANVGTERLSEARAGAAET